MTRLDTVYGTSVQETRQSFIKYPQFNYLNHYYLNNSWVSERLIQDVHLTAELQGVNYEILFSCGDLHQTGDAEETPIGMVL